MTMWNYCEEDKHEFSPYVNILGKQVCFTCDPLSENNYHRPLARIELGRILGVHPSFFEVNPVWFLDNTEKPISFKNCVFGETYTCPFCQNEIDWYKVGEVSKWCCNC